MAATELQPMESLGEIYRRISCARVVLPDDSSCPGCGRFDVSRDDVLGLLQAADPDGRLALVLHIAAGAAFMDIIVGCLCEPQSGIKLAACQESGVRGDGSATKSQADSAVELELQRGVGAFTHWVPPARLRYPELDPLARPL